MAWVELFTGRAQPRRVRTGTFPTLASRERDESGPALSRASAWSLLDLAALACLAACVVAILDFGVPPPSFKVGDRVSSDLTARVDFSYLDPDWLDEQRVEAADRTPLVFRQVPNWKRDLLKDLKQLCEVAENSGNVEAARALALSFSREQKLVVELFNYNHDRGAKTLTSRLLPHIDDFIRGISPPSTEKLLTPPIQGVVSSEDYDRVFRKKGEQEIMRIDLSHRERIVKLGELLSVPFAKSNLEQQFILDKSLPEGLQRALLGHLLGRLNPNLIEDKRATEEWRQKAREGVPDLPHKVEKGTVLLAKDKPVRPETLVKLREEALAYKASLTPLQDILRLSGLSTLVLGVLFFHFLAVRRVRGGGSPRRAQLMLALTCLAVLAGAKALMQHELPSQLAPVAFAAAIASLALNTRVALLTACSLSLLVGFAAGGDMLLTLTLLVGALVAALPAERLQNRWDLLSYGVRGGLAQGLLVAGLSMLRSATPLQGTGLVQGGGSGIAYPALGEAPWALFNGLACGLLLLGSLPLVELSFGIITNIRLYELCDQNQPALRRLMLECPGTWAHTLQVAFLSEPAAEAIGANARLVRAGVYYHDLGKTVKPEYFVENQLDAEARHRRLAPSVSALIITAHVKDGIELAREYRLPAQIIDFIPEHHGTTLVSYFYHSARMQAQSSTSSGGPGAVQEAFFRYPGPKPQTRETAIVMLADTVEAATRTLDGPSASRLRTFVHELIMQKLLDGQLDECELTFRNLAVIEDVFLRVLVSRFHGRIRYPGQEEGAPPQPAEAASAASFRPSKTPAPSSLGLHSAPLPPAPPAPASVAAPVPAGPSPERATRLHPTHVETKVLGRKPAPAPAGSSPDADNGAQEPGSRVAGR